jgi:hypothetical protein
MVDSRFHGNDGRAKVNSIAHQAGIFLSITDQRFCSESER